MKNPEQKIPALRFPEFSGEWEEKRLGEIANRVTKKNVDKEVSIVFSNSAVNGIVKQEDYFDFSVANEINNDRYYIVKKNDFVYNPRISVSAPVGPLKRSHFEEEGIISPLYTVLRFKDGCLDFYEIYFNSTHWHTYMKKVANYGVRFDRMNVTNEDLLNLPLPFPSLPEQQKIADFLSAVDKRLQLLKDKKTKLEEYKRGVMQRIFSQELRFTRPDGSAYPDWEEKKLGEIGTTYNGLSGKTAEDFGLGKSYIQYKQIFDNSKIDINKCGFVNIVNGEKQNEVVYGDILFTTSSETPHEVGFSSVILDEVKNTYLNSFCFRPNSLTELYPSFSRYLFRSETVRKDIITLAQGSTRYNMSKIEFLKIGTFIPCLDEQRQIADFLSAIDDKISLLSKQIQSTEQYKKGLLQQMFV